MHGALTVMKRELRGFFLSPVAYVFIVIFLLSTAGSAWYLGGFYRTNQASLEVFFFFHPWLYLILIPAVGMRLWSEELRSGTVELLFTLPVELSSLVAGKFLAAWIFVAVGLALTFPMPWTVFYLGDPDGGVILSGYLGSLLMAGAYLAVTSLTSALTRNQVISFITSFLVCLILVLLGWGVLSRSLLNFLSPELVNLIAAFSFTTHFNGLRRGLIDFRDVVYFISLIVFLLMANTMVLHHRRR